MQLSAKALLRPFSNSAEDGDATECGNDADVGAELIDEDGDYDEDSEGEDEGEAMNDDEEDPFESLDEVDREELLENTAAVRSTLNKVGLIFLFPDH
jgi:hypothetical protein